ncbi:MAG TPA: RsmE family RNA methyltransferase [Thermoanaerobaculia bacterium]|nr:RsmE family RNA methyltransferase [Thermoanaerobaculia bacterium]
MDHRIYYPSELTAGSEVSIAGDEYHHAARVARVRAGEPVELFDGRGAAAAGEVIEIQRDALRVRITGPVPPRESPLNVTLAMAVIQLEKFELVLQKATELGVRSFIPLVTDRVEVRPERYRGKAKRWEKIVFEAVKQSGRAALPSIETPAPFAEVVGREGMRILFDAEGEEARTLSVATSVTILIGPEGGWSESEVGLARERQCRFLRLGPRRLRSETAAIAAAGILAAQHGDI